MYLCVTSLYTHTSTLSLKHSLTYRHCAETTRTLTRRSSSSRTALPCASSSWPGFRFLLSHPPLTTHIHTNTLVTPTLAPESITVPTLPYPLPRSIPSSLPPPLQWTVEEFETTHNPDNCGVAVMDRIPGQDRYRRFLSSLLSLCGFGGCFCVCVHACMHACVACVRGVRARARAYR